MPRLRRKDWSNTKGIKERKLLENLRCYASCAKRMLLERPSDLLACTEFISYAPT